MKCRTDGRVTNTARMFSTPGTPPRHCRAAPCSPLWVSTSQYPIRPIRKYSRGVICRGRRCPIGRHRFSWRRAPRTSADAVGIAGGSLALARDASAGQLYYRVWSDITFTPGRKCFNAPKSKTTRTRTQTHTHTRAPHTHVHAYYKKILLYAAYIVVTRWYYYTDRTRLL